MAQVIVIRKPDRTIHTSPYSPSIKATLTRHISRLPADKKWKLEMMDEAEAKNLPFFDPNYVSPAQAQNRLKQVEGALTERDSEIERLKSEIAALQGSQSGEKISVKEPSPEGKLFEEPKNQKKA